MPPIKHNPAIKAVRARRHGGRYTWTIATACLRAGIPYAVGFALVEQESNFQNVFGHDPGGLFKGEKVTNDLIERLIKHVQRGGVSNGVGFTQLTWIGFIRDAHRRKGGAASVRNQVDVAFEVLASYRREEGEWHKAFRRYNGAGVAAEAYADEMFARYLKWKRWLR